MILKLAPVVVFAYNRPSHLERTLEALASNLLAPQTDVWLFLDGCKNNDDELLQKQIFIYLSEGIKNKFHSFEVVHSNVNKGLSRSIVDGVTRVLGDRGRVIVLEDDLVTSKYFLQYMNDSLCLYENEEKVISIHGYVGNIDVSLSEPFFLKGADCWGWATWSRGWRIFDHDGKKLLNEIINRKLQKEFNFNNSFEFVKMLRDQSRGLTNSWAIRWYAAAFLMDRLTLYPHETLVQNIGLDGSGTNCKSTDYHAVEIRNSPIVNFPSEIKPSKEGFDAYCRFYLSLRRGVLQRVSNKLKEYVRLILNKR
jgi:hypothetical protein